MDRRHVALQVVKVVHTIVWAFFAACILALPVYAWRGDFATCALLIGIVMVEVAVLVANRMRCPLTAVAARYTDEKRDNFDIYLPQWLARHNQRIFGWLFIAGVGLTLVRWGGW